MYKLHSWLSAPGLQSWQHGSAAICVEFSGGGHNLKSCKSVPVVGWHASKQHTSTLKARRPAPLFVITCYSLVTAWGEEKSAHIFHFSLSSIHIIFSEQHICESKPVCWRLGKVTSEPHHNINCIYYTQICSKWLYKSSFRERSWNPFSPFTGYTKEYLFDMTRIKEIFELFNALNTEQQQSYKLELIRLKIFFFCFFHISWSHPSMMWVMLTKDSI